MIYFLIWCVLMLGQAYWLYWLENEVIALENDFERYLPIVNAEAARRDNLTASTNK